MSRLTFTRILQPQIEKEVEKEIDSSDPEEDGDEEEVSHSLKFRV